MRARGGEVRFGETVGDIGSLRAQFPRIIVAVGPHQLKNVMPETELDYTYQPIYTCYLQYPESTRLEFPMLGIGEGLVQWVFDRGALLGEKGRLACVISAQGDHQQMTQDELARLAISELRKALPRLPSCAVEPRDRGEARDDHLYSGIKARQTCVPRLPEYSSPATTRIPSIRRRSRAAVRSGTPRRAARCVIATALELA